PGDVLGDLVGPGGGDAEDGCGHAGAGGVHPLPALGEEADDGVLGLALLPRVDDLVQGVGTTHVVVHDVVDTETGGLFGQRHVVFAHVGIERIGETAVLAVGSAVRVLDDPGQVRSEERRVGKGGRGAGRR